MGAFGDKLRKQREQRGIALDAISNTTKISTRMLRALEDEHFDQLPGGVFNKGFVRAYARQVGLDEEEAITDYLTALRESQVQQQSILPDFRAPAGKPNDAAPEPRQPNRHDQNVHSHDRHDKDRDDKDRHADARHADARHADARHSDHLPINDFPGSSGNQDRSHSVSARNRRKEDRRNRNQDLSQLLASAENAPAAGRFREKYSAGDPGQTPDQLSAQIPWTKLAAALLLVTLVLAVWNSRRHDESASHTAAASQPSPAPSPAAVAAPVSMATQPSASSGSPSRKSGKESSLATLPPAKLAAGIIPAAAAHPATISAPPTATATATPSPTRQTPSSASSVDAASSSSNKPIASPPSVSPTAKGTVLAAANPASTFTLLIRAEKTSWVSIAADGKPVAEETLIAPAHTSVRASTEVVVKTGNAAGVSFQLNGKEFPAQGSDGEVKTYIFDATGIRVIPQTQPPATDR